MNNFNLGISLGIGSSSVGPPAGSGGGGGSAPPITDNLSVYFSPDIGVFSDAGVTPVVDNDNIRQMNDQSGNSNVLSQATASLQPLWKENYFGAGASGIYAKNDGLVLTDVISPSTNIDFTVYYVYQRDSTSNTSYMLRGTVSAYYPFTNLNSSSHLWRSNNGGTAVNNAYTATLNTEIACSTFNRTTGEGKLYINNVLQGTYALSASRNFDSYNRFFANTTHGIHYGNMLWYVGAAHDASEVGTMSDWLNTKYSTY